MTNLPNLYFTRFVFEIKFVNGVSFPAFWGNMLKTEFLRAFRSTLCKEKLDDCKVCNFTDSCKYYSMFEKEKKYPDYYYLKSVKTFPFPFIIHQPETSKRKFFPNDRLELIITVFGKYIELFDNIRTAITNWGNEGFGKEKAKFIITNLYVMDYKDKKTNAINKETNLPETNLPVIGSDIFNKLNYNKYNKAVLDFNTPLQLMNKGKVITNKEDLTVKHILEAVERRYLSSAYLFCDNENLGNINLFDRNLDFPQIISNTLKFVETEKFNRKKKKTGDSLAMMGNLILFGDFSKVGVLLHVGSFLGIGKSTLAGNGNYTIIFKES
jgi:hypothetical protein